MTDITLEQRAATVPPTTAVTFVPAFSEASRMLGMSAANGNHDGVVYWQGIVEQFEAAAKEALRLSAGADSARLDALEALVDSQPDKALLLHHGQHGINGRYAGLGLSNTRRTLREAIDQAAPRHEPGEG